MALWIGAAGLTATIVLIVVLVICEVRRSNRIVGRAARMAALPDPTPEIDWTVWEEVFS